MPLDPKVREFLDAGAAAGLPAYEDIGPVEARALYRQVVAARRGPDYVPEPVGSVEDRVLDTSGGTLAVRIVTPEGDGGPYPGLVFFHGGGWTIGDLDTHDGMVRSICRRAGVVVVSVDYRLAPEHRFPAAFEDCAAATRWVAEHAAEVGVSPTRLAVGGDSAGGNLAAAVALHARDSGGPPLAAQLLVYPATDASMSRPSVVDNGVGYGLTASTMRWFTDNYTGPAADLTDPLLSPLAAADLAGLPPAVVATAEFDPLRDEGDEYAERLADAGVPVRHIRAAGQIHGFLGMGSLVPAADAAVTDLCHALRDLLHDA